MKLAELVKVPDAVAYTDPVGGVWVFYVARTKLGVRHFGSAPVETSIERMSCFVLGMNVASKALGELISFITAKGYGKLAKTDETPTLDHKGRLSD